MSGYLRYIASFVCALLICIPGKSKTVILSNGMDCRKLDISEGDIVLVKKKVDLMGQTLCLPAESVVEFRRRGAIFNGHIVGNNSAVVSGKRVIFADGVSVSGTWKCEAVYGEWAGLKDGAFNDLEFARLMALCKGCSLTHLYTGKGHYYVTPKAETGAILVPDNVYWHNNSTIELAPCSFMRYSLVYLNKVNSVVIDGGEFIGDLEKHSGTAGEWGHGIKVGGSKDIVLKNLSCNKFWGDGIDLIEGRDKDGNANINCENISIENVMCHYNRRQGMSIEAAINVVVENSDFSHTGKLGAANPSAGIDIEPWNNDGNDKVGYITIHNCTFSDNVGYDIQDESNMQDTAHCKERNNHIVIDSCKMTCLRASYTCGTTIRDCEISGDCDITFADHITVVNSKAKRFFQHKNGNHIKIDNGR